MDDQDRSLGNRLDAPIAAAGNAAASTAPGADDLAELIARRAVDLACSGPAELGIRFHRVSRPTVFHKAHALGPSLTVVGRGRKVVRFDDRELAYDAGRYIVILGEATFDAEVIGATAAQPYLAATIELPIDVIVKMQLALAAAPADGAGDEPPPPAYVAPLDPALLGVVTRLVATLDDPVERRVLAPVLQEELVFRLLRSPAAVVVRPPVAARDVRTIHEAMRFIRDNATRTLSVPAIARHVAMSPSHFAHRFRAVARVSPIRYLKQVRLEAARTMICSTPLRVAEVAARAGYESTSHFSRDFKATFGLTPSELARRIAGSGASPAASSIATFSPRP